MLWVKGLQEAGAQLTPDYRPPILRTVLAVSSFMFSTGLWEEEWRIVQKYLNCLKNKIVFRLS